MNKSSIFSNSDGLTKGTIYTNNDVIAIEISVVLEDKFNIYTSFEEQQSAEFNLIIVIYQDDEDVQFIDNSIFNANLPTLIVALNYNEGYNNIAKLSNIAKLFKETNVTNSEVLVINRYDNENPDKNIQLCALAIHKVLVEEQLSTKLLVGKTLINWNFSGYGNYQLLD